MPTKKHVHNYKLVKKHVLLHDIVYEDGKPKRNNTVGKDIIKMWVCVCKDKFAFDLERKIV